MINKIPPQSIQTEEGVLCSFLIDPESHEHIPAISADDFYKTAHQDIYTCILRLYKNNDPVDLITVVDELKKNGKLENSGGATYIAYLTNDTPIAANVEKYIQIIKEKAVLRRLIRASSIIQQRCYGDCQDIDTVVSEAHRGINSIDIDTKSDTVLMSEILPEIVEDLEKIQISGKTVGLKTGFRVFDSVTGGLHDGDLITIAGRPSSGKTALSLSVVDHISKKNPALFFSLEMSKRQLAQRAISKNGVINYKYLVNANLDDHKWRQIVNGVSRLDKKRLFLNDNVRKLTDILRVSRKMKKKHDISVVVIDYLKLIKTETKERRDLEVAYITGELKALARELNIPVVALSQLNRKVEDRNNKRPIMSDLKESGSIEEDSDVVIFVYRDEYYYPNDDNPDFKNITGYSSNKGIAEIIISKNRNGATGRVLLRFKGEIMSFFDIEQY